MEIDWVKIPAGEFLTGLSEMQKENLLEQALIQHDVERLNPPVRNLIKKATESIRQGNSDAPEIKAASETYVGRAILTVEQFLQQTLPQRAIRLEEFYIARFPITRKQYDMYLLERGLETQQPLNEWTYPSSHEPMLTGWAKAVAFCHHIGGRLPTKEEWEKAARGTDGRLYPWGDKWDPSRGNFFPGWPKWRSSIMTPVDIYPDGISPYGVWDMAGNVYEWTSTPVSSPGLYRPVGDSVGKHKFFVLKSCFVLWEKYYGMGEAYNLPWLNNLIVNSSAGFDDSNGPYFGTGFRPVRDP